MSLPVFKPAQITPINAQTIPTTKTLSSKPLLPMHRPPPVYGKLCNGQVVRASLPRPSPAVVDGDAMALLERCFRASPPSDSPSLASSSSLDVIYGPVMKGQYGAFGAATLEKSKLDMSQKQQSKSSPELFDQKFVDAVLNEWQRTMMDLPAGMRQAYEMGLVSSAQMVKFLAINARPTTARFISRMLPQGMSRAFIGRQDDCRSCIFIQAASGAGCHSWLLCLVELKNRKERIKQEWDLALVNVLTVTTCNAVVVWSLAPCHSYGSTFRFDLQNTLQKLPNNMFEMSYPLRQFDLQKRIHSFLYKAAELCMVGFSAGAVQGALSNLCASKKEGRLSVTIPTVNNNALGYGAFLGIYANLRYQLLCGIDKAMINCFDVIGVPLFFSTALRIVNVQLGETSRLAWHGVEVDLLAQSDYILKAYDRPSEPASQPSSNWFISKNAIVSGLGLLGLKQGQGDYVADEGEASPPKARRERVVLGKLTTSSA
ncbi:hypothetical protein ACSBR1_022681 [Camellia fascicularis]